MIGQVIKLTKEYQRLNLHTFKYSQLKYMGTGGNPCQVRVHVCLGVDDANHRRLDNVYAFGCVD